MKKSIITLKHLFCIALIISAISATGCGKSEKEDSLESLEQELISAGADEDDVEIIVNALNELENESVVEESSTQITINDFNSLSFDPMDEIKNASLYECKTQVADLLVTPTTIIGDFFSQVENSSVDWEYEYNPEQLVPKHELIDMSLLYNGDEIISFYAYNITENTLTLKECLLGGMDVNYNYVTSNIYYGNGYSIDGKNVPNYMEFKELAKKYHRSAGDFEKIDNNGDHIIISFSLHSCDIIVPSLAVKLHSGANPIWMKYEYCFDSSDGNCTSAMAKMDLFTLSQPFDANIEKNEFTPIGIETQASIINEDFVGTYIDTNGNKLVLDEYGLASYNDLPGFPLYWSYEDEKIKLAKIQSTTVLCTSESTSLDILELKCTKDGKFRFEEGTYTKAE